MKDETVTDFGLFPGTFIKPAWRDVPSLFRHPKQRLKLEWVWIKMSVQNFFMYDMGQIISVQPMTLFFFFFFFFFFFCFW